MIQQSRTNLARRNIVRKPHALPWLPGHPAHSSAPAATQPVPPALTQEGSKPPKCMLLCFDTHAKGPALKRQPVKGTHTDASDKGQADLELPPQGGRLLLCSPLAVP